MKVKTLLKCTYHMNMEVWEEAEFDIDAEKLSIDDVTKLLDRQLERPDKPPRCFYGDRDGEVMEEIEPELLHGVRRLMDSYTIMSGKVFFNGNEVKVFMANNDFASEGKKLEPAFEAAKTKECRAILDGAAEDGAEGGESGSRSL